MRKILFCVLVLAAFVSGCSGNQATNRSASEEKRQEVSYSFSVNENYQTVYLRIHAQAEKCVKLKGISRPKVIGEISEGSRSAKIDVAQEGLWGLTTHMTIRLTTENKATRVDVKNSYGRWDNYARAVKQWALGKSDVCTAA